MNVCFLVTLFMMDCDACVLTHLLVTGPMCVLVLVMDHFSGSWPMNNCFKVSIKIISCVEIRKP